MRAALKVAVVVLPFVAVALAIRACSLDEGEDWLATVLGYDPDVVLGVDDEDLIVIAPDPEDARAVADEIRFFRRGLVEEFGDLLGRPRAATMIAVVFSSHARFLEYARDKMRHDPGGLYGYTDPKQEAIFVPVGSVRTLRHETVHWVVGVSHSVHARPSPWLSEGLAQLFETYEPGHVPPGLGIDDLGFLRTVLRAPIDPQRLIELQDYAAFLADGRRNYVEALVLTAFLFERRPRETLARYLDEELKTEPAMRPRLFETTYHHRDEPFRTDFADYVRALRGR